MRRQRRQVEVGEDAREAEIDGAGIERVAGGTVAHHAVVIERRDLDRAVGQADAEPGPDHPVDHGDVELKVVADQRPRADEPQEAAHGLARRQPVRDIHRAQPVHRDRGVLDRGGGAHQQLQALAQQQAVAADADGGKADDVAAPAAEAGGFGIEDDRLGGIFRLEQKGVGGVAQAGPRSGAVGDPAMQELAHVPALSQKASRRK